MGTIVVLLLVLAIVWAARSTRVPLLSIWVLALAGVLMVLELRSDRS